MKILFISRAYPPTVGGIENQNYELSVWLGKIATVKTVANRCGKFFLPFFLPWAVLRALFSAARYDAVLLGDGVLAVVGWSLKLFTRKPVISVLHGLDLTYPNQFYQRLWVRFFLKRLDKFIAVGNETVRVAKEKGIAPEKIVFIPNGVDPQKFSAEYPREKLAEILKTDLSGKKFILTAGRLAKRKGVAWFVEKVMPKLPDNLIYVIAGDGPDKERIRSAVAKNNLFEQVKLLGYVSDERRNILFQTCDLFVQPNIKVEGDMEGFGISVIEAAGSGLPVVAARLEGLQDAIQDGRNGFLVDSGNADAFAFKINELLADENLRRAFGRQAREYVKENYAWDKISQKYLEEIKKLTDA